MKKKINSLYLVSLSYHRQSLGHIYISWNGKGEGVTKAFILKPCRVSVLLSGLTLPKTYLQQFLISPLGQCRATEIAGLQTDTYVIKYVRGKHPLSTQLILSQQGEERSFSLQLHIPTIPIIGLKFQRLHPPLQGAKGGPKIHLLSPRTGSNPTQMLLMLCTNKDSWSQERHDQKLKLEAL